MHDYVLGENKNLILVIEDANIVLAEAANSTSPMNSSLEEVDGIRLQYRKLGGRPASTKDAQLSYRNRASSPQLAPSTITRYMDLYSSFLYS